MLPPMSEAQRRCIKLGDAAADVGDATGRSWEDSWVGVTWLTHDLPTIYKAKPERWEAELYKTDASEGQPGQGLQQAGLQAPCTAQRDRATGTARGLSKRGRRGGA